MQIGIQNRNPPYPSECVAFDETVSGPFDCAPRILKSLIVQMVPPTDARNTANIATRLNQA